jgi:hypothetical protein
MTAAGCAWKEPFDLVPVHWPPHTAWPQGACITWAISLP